MAAELEERARTGAPGARLPSVRELQRRHHLGPATIRRAVADLERRGLLETRPGSGTFVASPARVPLAGGPAYDWQTATLGPTVAGTEAMQRNLAPLPPGVIPLSTGYLSLDMQPVGVLAQAASRAGRRGQAWVRPPAEGTEELRRLFAEEHGGPGVSERNVLVTNGGQPALATCFAALASPGEAIVVESPTYQGALGAARSAGLVPLGVPADRDGIQVERLEPVIRSSGAKIVYVQPRWLNPTGAQLHAERGQALMRVLEETGAFLIEDDSARDLELSGDTFAPLAVDDPDGHVVYLRSLTKPVSPSLRIGCLVARGPALVRLRGVHSLRESFVSPLLQEIAFETLTAPGWRRHIRRVREELARRRDAMIGAVEALMPSWTVALTPRCGMHLWLRLPEGDDEDKWVDTAARAQVTITAGRHCFPAEPTASHLRLTYSSASPELIVTAVDRVAAAFAPSDA